MVMLQDGKRSDVRGRRVQVFKNAAFLITLNHSLLTVYWHCKPTVAIF